ncbi:MAG: hypothetical protein KAI66_23450, partial [Lentisphaeria bacterium]|nr:hypothetical protein [Lentisphaeria bacterium]
IQHIPMQPDTAYHLAGRIKCSAPTKNISIAVAEFIGSRVVRMHKIGGDDQASPNEWQRYETTFTTGSGSRHYAVYLYNVHNDGKAWYDDIELKRIQ